MNKEFLLKWLALRIFNAKDQVKFLLGKSAVSPDLAKQRELLAVLEALLEKLKQAPDDVPVPKVTSAQAVKMERAEEKEKALPKRRGRPPKLKEAEVDSEGTRPEDAA